MDSYNYSALSAAYKCNRYFKLLYVDRLTPKVAKSADLMFGSSFHFALEEYFTAKVNLVDSFHTYWDAEADKLEYGRYGREALESNAKTLLERFERLHAKKITVSQIERRLYGSLPGGIKVEGTPDILGDFEGLPSVIDFKTAGYRFPKEKIEINEQMVLYAHLAMQNGYTPKQLVYIVFIKGNTPSIQTLTYELKPDHIERVLENVRIQCESLNRMQEENKFSYNSNSCQQGDRKCDFFDHCWGKKAE